MNKHLIILGTRGIPAQHGGFETFAEHLASFMVGQGWKVTVYCQIDEGTQTVYETWQGVDLVKIPVTQQGALGTIIFDLKATLHSIRNKGLYLVLGYNTAVFGLLYRLVGRPHLINMDGIEWKREKWGKLAKTWFYLNERFGCWLGNGLVADHPQIKAHLATRVSGEKITTIAYGSDVVNAADESLLQAYGVEKDQFAIVIARPEPENSILEIVEAFCRKDRKGFKLVVLGNYQPGQNDYHQAVLAAANEQVVFPGAVYDTRHVQALRYFSAWYFHGHKVGGTNPALVEALGAGCPIVAHNNRFNQWVVGDGAQYFSSVVGLSDQIGHLIESPRQLEKMSAASRKRHQDAFQWQSILKAYQSLFEEWLAPSNEKNQ